VLSSLNTKPNPAEIKIHILKTSNKLVNVPFTDQGSGVFNIGNIRKSFVEEPIPKPYVYPEELDLTSSDYTPFSSILFYSSMFPIAFNFTVIHPASAHSSQIEDIFWKTENEQIHSCFQISYEKSEDIIQYYTLVRMQISVLTTHECQYAQAEGEEIITYISFSNNSTEEDVERLNSTIVYNTFSMTVNLVPTPQRSDRILIDSFHNLKFPEDGYILRDSIFIDKQPYEWKGDHAFTNYIQLYQFLRSQGYYIEILNEPITCFDSRNFGTFILADPEKGLSRNEVIKLRKDIETRGLSLIIIAEWSDKIMIK